MRRPNSTPGCTRTAARSPRELVAMGVRGSPALRLCASSSLDDVLAASCLGRVPDVRSRRAQASTFAQVRTTSTHVHSHSVRVCTYTPAILDVLHHRKHTVSRLTARVPCAQKRNTP